MIGHAGLKYLMMLWYTEVVGWVVSGKKSIEKPVELALTYETDVTNLHGALIPSARTWIP